MEDVDPSCAIGVGMECSWLNALGNDDIDVDDFANVMQAIHAVENDALEGSDADIEDAHHGLIDIASGQPPPTHSRGPHERDCCRQTDEGATENTNGHSNISTYM